MFGVGGLELFLVLVVALLVMDPKELQIVVKKLYHAWQALFDYFNYIKESLQSEIKQNKTQSHIASPTEEKLSLTEFKKNHYSQQVKEIEK